MYHLFTLLDGTDGKQSIRSEEITQKIVEIRRTSGNNMEWMRRALEEIPQNEVEALFVMWTLGNTAGKEAYQMELLKKN